MSKRIAVIAVAAVMALSACGPSGPPQACLNAMNRADEVILFSSKADMAIVNGDHAAFESWLSDMKASGSLYVQAKEECKAS